MHKLQEYTQYNNEKNIALLDNSSVAFLEKLKSAGVASEALLRDYDVILIPYWVLEEIRDSQYRETYLNSLVDSGFPVCWISEANYSGLMNDEEINLFKIVQASISRVGDLQRYIRKNVKTEDLLDLEDSSVWLPLMHQNWPIPGELTTSGRRKKKNAGEISLTILAEVFAWYYPMLTSLTVLTQDVDAYNFIQNAHAYLEKDFADKYPITITYKSNDFFLCNLFRSGYIRIEDINTFRKDARKVTYTQRRADKSTALITEVLNNSAFEQLIQDPTTQILF